MDVRGAGARRAGGPAPAPGGTAPPRGRLAAAGAGAADRPGRPRVPFRGVAALAAALAAAGCGSVFSPLELGPGGLRSPDAELRTLLLRGRFETALSGLASGRLDVGDDLLRLQHEGLVAHYAGRWEESNAALEAAASLSEDRVTRSLSRAALSMILNDRVIPYDPSRAERLLMHYYGALNYLALGDPEEAAVEARRLSHRLEVQERDRAVDPRSAEGRLRAALYYLAGAVFEAAGEENDAAVAYRRAGLGEELEGGAARTPRPEAPLAGSAPRDAGASGEVLLVVERGFVAHRVERSATLLLEPDELGLLRVEDPEETAEAGPAVDAALRLAREVLGRETGPAPAPGASLLPGLGTGGGVPAGVPRQRRRSRTAESARPYLLRVTWPEYVSGALSGSAFGRGPRTGDPVGPAPPLRFAASAGTAEAGAPGVGDPPLARLDGSFVAGPGRAAARAPVRWVGSLSGAVMAEHAAEAPLALAKSILRGAAKLALARGLEEAVEEESEVLGELVGVAGNVAAVLTERADTRSWHLAPAELGLVRLRLPAGSQPLSVLLPGGASVELGPVEVRADGLTVVSTRAW